MGDEVGILRGGAYLGSGGGEGGAIGAPLFASKKALVTSCCVRQRNRRRNSLFGLPSTILQKMYTLHHKLALRKQGPRPPRTLPAPPGFSSVSEATSVSVLDPTHPLHNLVIIV